MLGLRVERPQATRRSSQNHYARLDVSLEETAICVVDGTGRIVKEARAASEPEALIAAQREIDLPLARVGLEACSLRPGFKTSCIRPACLRSASKTRCSSLQPGDRRW